MCPPQSSSSRGSWRGNSTAGSFSHNSRTSAVPNTLNSGRHRNSNRLSAASMAPQDIRRTTRDLQSRPTKINLRDLPLVSRSGDSQGPSLRDLPLQQELWIDLRDELRTTQFIEQPAPFQSLLDPFRKLREGVRATNWSNGDYMFAVQVYEAAAFVALRARDVDALWTCQRILVDELYKLAKVTNWKYIALDAMMLALRLDNTGEALLRLKKAKNVHYTKYARAVVNAWRDTNSPAYNHLMKKPLHPDCRIMLELFHTNMQERALKVMTKAYMSAPGAWVEHCIGDDLPALVEKKLLPAERMQDGRLVRPPRQ
ncbi:hypothetical protein BC940DRAFT_305758 [Gongronella butleri]|nr:hypothetical protein BC940DRAFT_305758 [Gongronella butleri]